MYVPHVQVLQVNVLHNVQIMDLLIQMIKNNVYNVM